MSDLAIIDWLLSQAVPENDTLTLADWKARFDHVATLWQHPIERALAGGWHADRVGYAFAAGYQSALRCLVPELPAIPYAALCVTETGGNHPRAIKTTLTPDGEGYLLSGEKTFVTHAKEAEILLVAASSGQDDRGRNKLQVVQMPAGTSGINITLLADLPFVPEISHGTVQFTDVTVAPGMILPGDGYALYVRPFRTIEDLHVFAGIMAYLLRVVGQMGWERDYSEQIIAMMTALIALAHDDPGAAHVHIAISGLRKQMAGLITQLEEGWGSVGDASWDHWLRDKRLLTIAESVRGQRLANAWAYFAAANQG